MINFAYAQTIVPNGDFENWIDQYHIDYWDGLNYDGTFLNFHTFSRTDDAHGGNYAAKIENVTDPLLGLIPGVAFTGTIDFDPQTFEYSFVVGVGVSGRPSKLKGYYKYSPVGGDTMAIVIGLFKWNELEQNLDSIGGGLFFTANTITTYSRFEIPIEYFVPDEEADTMYIMMFSSTDTYHEGSVLKVDDLTLDYSGAGINNNYYTDKINCYPNPADDCLFIELISPLENGEVIITNILGSEVYKVRISNNDENKIPVGFLNNGIYFATISSNNRQIYSRKILIQH